MSKKLYHDCVKIQQWGNSSAIRIPKTIVDIMRISPADEVNISVFDDGTITIQKSTKPKEELSMKNLFSDYAEEVFETDLKNPQVPVGKELW